MNEYQSVREFAAAFASMVSAHFPDICDGIPGMQDNLEMPSAEELESLLIPTLVASVRHEESRPVTFRWILPLHKSKETPANLFLLEEPRPFTVAEVVRLSPVVSSGMRCLVLNLASGRPRIVGIEDSVIHGGTSQLVYQLSNFRMEVIECNVLGSGHLRIRWGYLSLDYDSYEVHQKLNFLLSDLKSLVDRVVSGAAVPTHASLPAESVARIIEENEGIIADEWHSGILRFWDRVLQRVQQAKHGGTFLIAGDKVEFVAHTKYALPIIGIANTVKMHALAGFRLMKDWNLEKEQQFDAVLCEFLELERRISHLIDLLAALAAVDGAVLMNRAFDVLGFGTRIAIDPKNADMEIDFEDWFDGDYRKTKRRMSTLGMRHLSAAEFVLTNEGSLAIVVSQDGNVRMFSKHAITKALDCAECFAPFGSFLQRERL
jgi:hypothetical protein